MLYGAPPKLPELVRVARDHLRADGVTAADLVVVGGAVDGISRVLDAHLSPGDLVGVEDPTFPPVFHVLGARPEQVRLSDAAPLRASVLEA